MTAYNDNDRVEILKGIRAGKKGTVTSLNVKVDGEATGVRAYDFSSVKPLVVTPPVDPPPVDPPVEPPTGTNQTSDRWYSASSVFNTPLPTTPTVLADSARLVSRLLGASATPGKPRNLIAGVGGTQYGWGHPIYFAGPNDPLKTITGLTMSGASALNGKKIRVPATAIPEGGTDHHLAVVYEGIEYDLWDVSSVTATTITARNGGYFPFTGTGVKLQEPNWQGSAGVASYVAEGSGIVRPVDFTDGECPHALFIVSKVTASPPVWPAAGSDGRTADGVPIGTWFQLDIPDSALVGFPAWKKGFLTACRKYGIFLGDSGGNGLEFQLQSELPWTQQGQPAPFVAYARSIGQSGNTFDIASGVDWAKYLRAVEPPR